MEYFEVNIVFVWHIVGSIYIIFAYFENDFRKKIAILVGTNFTSFIFYFNIQKCYFWLYNISLFVKAVIWFACFLNSEAHILSVMSFSLLFIANVLWASYKNIIFKVSIICPNGWKGICKISNSFLVKTAGHLPDMFARCLKGSFFANLNSV